MRKYYHIILFLLTVVCFFAGIFIYFTFRNTLTLGIKDFNNQKPFKPITFTENLPKKSIWEKPTPQSNGDAWVFQVFTPPKIWIDEKGNFTAEAFTKPIPFGISLVSFDKQKYRYRFLSSLGKRDNPEIIILLDLKTGKELRVQQNKDYDDFRVIKYKVMRREVTDSLIDGKPLFDKVPTLEVLDKSSGIIFDLSVGKDIYTEQYLIGLKSDQRSEPFFVKDVGDTFNATEADYRIEAINSKEKSVRILKSYQNPSGETKEHSETLFLEKPQKK